MKNFVKGALFVAVILPLIDSLMSLVTQGVDYLCNCIAVQTYLVKKPIQDELDSEGGNEHTYAMGFPLPYNDDECEDDEEEYDE